MQGIGAHKNGVLVAMWLECYVLLHYFERGRGPKGGFWSQVKPLKSLCKAWEHIKMAFLVAMWLECYVLLHYFERGKGPQGAFWGQVKVPPHKGSSTVPRFGTRETVNGGQEASHWQSEMSGAKVI